LELRDVIGHVTIRLAVGHFLCVVHCDHGSIWHRYGDTAPQTLDARTDAQVILYSVQCYALHWTDNKVEANLFASFLASSSQAPFSLRVAQSQRSKREDRSGVYSCVALVASVALRPLRALGENQAWRCVSGA